MSPLSPSLEFRQWLWISLVAAAGALVAGTYGILHDQVTYTIAPEYFTRMKFDQFHFADLGWPPRVFVAEIGFLATWWVGLPAGWVLARIALPAWPQAQALRRCARGFAIIIGTAAAAGAGGYFFGLFLGGDPAGWQEYCRVIGVEDADAFVRVAATHNASYIGGGIGLVAAVLDLVRLRMTR